jgi:hypothetical protein
LGRFDVCDRPGPATRYDPTAGHRINTMTGLAECVHPCRVQLPVGRYASNGDPAPVTAPPEPADDAFDLDAWFTARRRETSAGSVTAP